MSANYYNLLGVPKDATAAEIRDAYRREAMKWHPDHNGGSKQAEERFKHLDKAFAVLSNPSSRMAYDAKLNADTWTSPKEPEGQRRSPPPREDPEPQEAAYEPWMSPDHNESWRTLFRRPKLGIGWVLFLVWIIISILHEIFPHGL